MCILSKKISDLVDSKNTPRIEGSATVTEALKIMNDFGTDIVGIECGGEFVGIFTRGDNQRKVIWQNLRPDETRLYQVMTIDPPCVKEDITVKEAYNAMLVCQWEFMPIVRDKCLQAIISLRELGEYIMQAYEKSEAEYRMVINYFKSGESYALADYDG